MPRHKKEEATKPEESLESMIERIMERVLERFTLNAPEMLRIGDVARMLAMSEPSVRRLTAAGLLPFYVTAAGRRYKREDVIDYINSLEPCNSMKP